MKIVIQRVLKASVEVDNKLIASIDQGLLVFIGFGTSDNETNCNLPFFIKKCVGLRIFSDSDDKMNLSVKDVGGQILVVSQFTLYAGLQKGMRPSFTDTLEPTKAKILYEKFCEGLEKELGESQIKRGQFGAHMNVQLINDGPGTFIL